MVDARPPASSARWRRRRSSAASARAAGPGGQLGPGRVDSSCIRAVLYAPWRIERESSAGPAIRGPSCSDCWPATPRSRSCTSRPTRNAGAAVGDLYPGAHARPTSDLRFSPLDAADLTGLDLVFCMLPHGASQDAAARSARPRRPRHRSRRRLPAAARRVLALVRRGAPRARGRRPLRVRARRALPRRHRDARARRVARLLSDRGEPRVRAAARARSRRAAHHRRRRVGRVGRGPRAQDHEPLLGGERERRPRTACSRTGTPRRWSRR